MMALLQTLSRIKIARTLDVVHGDGGGRGYPADLRRLEVLRAKTEFPAACDRVSRTDAGAPLR